MGASTKKHLPLHYRRWANMKSRCHGKSYHNRWYKDRGIKVCKEWRTDFLAFSDWCLKTYEAGKTLDRIDNNGDYSPENCKWSSQKEQMQNSRRWTKDKLRAIKQAHAGFITATHDKFGDPKTRTEKRCCDCKEFKDNSFFHKMTAASDGLASFCKKCSTISRRKYNKNKYGSNREQPKPSI